MPRAALHLLLLSLLVVAAPARAAFVDGVEHFDGTTLDLTTWTVGDYGDGSVTQSDALTVDWRQEYSTIATIGYPVKVSVDVLSVVGTARLYLGSRLLPNLPTDFESWSASIGYDRGNRCFHATVGSGARQDSILLGFQQFDPPTPEAPYRIELERPNRSSMIYRAYSSTGELLVEVTRPFYAVFFDGTDVPLHLTLGTCCSGPGTFDDVRLPIASSCGNGTIEPSENCDDGNTSDGDCCSSTCQLESGTTVCRPATGDCDVAETCTGASASCPADGFVAAGTSCAADGDACTSDACNGSGACTHAFLPDSDGDTICDARDACTNVGEGRDFITRPDSRASLGKVNTDTTSGNDTLTLSGSFVLPAGRAFADLDPRVRGARVVIRTVLGNDVVDVTLPAGAYTGSGTRGWKTNLTRTLWQYLDQTPSPVSGITRIKATDRSKGRPGGTVAVRATGKKGRYPVAAGDVPLAVTVVLGDQSDAIAGMCGESAFTVADCAFNGKANLVRCQR